MRLRQKTGLMVVGGSVVLAVVLVLATGWLVRYFTIAGATRYAQTSAEMTRVALTEAMLNNATDKLDRLLARLAETRGLAEVRVARSPRVVQQFGPGPTRSQQADEIDEQVLASGRPRYLLVTDQAEPMFRATIPYIADTRGTPNCLTCHQVPEGTVLGAVTIQIALGEIQQQGLFGLLFLGLTILCCVPVLLLLLRYLYQPVVAATEAVEQVVGRAGTGDLSVRVSEQGDDEAGRIAAGLNQLLDLLEQGLRGISERIGQLIRYDGQTGRNLMAETTRIVDELVDGARFKQAIEEDETKAEVYERLADVIRHRLGVERFTVFEVDDSKNHMLPVVLDGTACEDNHWCDPQILVRAEACRVRRTGHRVDAFQHSGICTMFTGKDEDPAMEHVCLPILQSGGVGSVVQLVAPASEAQRLADAVPFLSIHLREAAPVLEAKRLMETLRESTLRDAMTGLYNRRFLEEYVDTLVARALRNQTHVGVLMLDLDYFKKVNDTYGHEAGDKVLVDLSRVIRQSVRAADLTIRFGGEEFMVILHDTDGDGAMLVAEKVRAAVEQMRVQLPGQALQKTLSIGVADFPADGESFWQVVKYADVALYAAKDAGRNRVERFRPEMWDGAAGEY